MKFNIRLLYLYLFSFVGLLIVVIGTGQLVNLGLKTLVFKDSDRYDITYYPSKVEGENQPSPEEMQRQRDIETKRQRQREFSGAASMIIVGLPLYLYHWNIIKKQKEN